MEYDLVFSSCGIAVMGAQVRPNALHITYVHTPQRDCWDLYERRQANRNWSKQKIFAASAKYVKRWELNAIQRVDHVVSNSQYIQSRVMEHFRRPSTVIYPPVNTAKGYLSEESGNYYFSLSRLDPEKRIDLLIAACNQMKRPLLIGGTGTDEARLRSLAGPTVHFLGRVPEDELPHFYARCRAFLFAADEDFGIAPVEAQSFGRPVIAYGHGGCLETVRVNDLYGRSNSGVLFIEQTAGAVMGAIQRFESTEDTFRPAEIQQHARQFDTSIFIKNVLAFVDAALEQKVCARPLGGKA
jgi:glycosyltransferase involved in cell wall biosynthesis